MFGNKEKKLEKMVEKKNAAGIIKLINDKDAAIALKAVASLGKVPGDDAYNALISLIRSPKAEIRAAAVTALAERGSPKAKAHIDHMLTGEKDAAVIAALKAAQAKIHGKE